MVQVGVLNVFSSNAGTRVINVSAVASPKPNQIVAIHVPPDEELVQSFGQLAHRHTLKIEADVENGKASNPRLAPEYFVTRLSVAEGLKVEFKGSCFVAPGQTEPDGTQMMTIAKEIASFMNGEGGELYFGVNDSGRVLHGIQADYARLAGGGDGITVATSLFSDAGRTYKGNADGFSLKLHAIARGYLGGAAESYLGECVEMGATGGRSYVKLTVNPAPDDVVVYLPMTSERGTFDALYIRNGAAVKGLIGSDRDQFIRARVKRQLLKEWRTVSAESGTANAKIDKMIAKLAEIGVEKVITGANVTVTGAVQLTEENLKPMTKPKGVVFDGEHLCDVKSWKGVFQAIYRKLNELNPAAFDTLPDDAATSKWFKRGKRCTKCYADKFGTQGDVRAVEMSGKAYLWNGSYFFRRVLVASGVDPSRFMIRA